jgi:hypothetical protein
MSRTGSEVRCSSGVRASESFDFADIQTCSAANRSVWRATARARAAGLPRPTGRRNTVLQARPTGSGRPTGCFCPDGATQNLGAAGRSENVRFRVQRLMRQPHLAMRREAGQELGSGAGPWAGRGLATITLIGWSAVPSTSVLTSRVSTQKSVVGYSLLIAFRQACWTSNCSPWYSCCWACTGRCARVVLPQDVCCRRNCVRPQRRISEVIRTARRYQQCRFKSQSRRRRQLLVFVGCEATIRVFVSTAERAGHA